MKKIYLAILLLGAGVMSVEARQALNVVVGDVAYNFPTNGDVIPFTSGSSFTIQGVTFNLSEVSRLEVLNNAVDDNSVLVEYNGNTASVTIAGNIYGYVNASITGANVVIDQSSEVGDNTCGEITYILKGTSDCGSFMQNGSYKSTIELQGLTLSNPDGAAIDIENGKRIDFSSKNNTVNTISDGVGGSQKAAIYCKGHLEMKGKGVLNVTGNTAHAISAKEYIEMKNCTVNILGSVKDGINCNQYFLIESGELNISNPGDDGIQVSYKDDSNREKEDTGSCSIKGGTVNIYDVTASAAKGIKTEGDFIISGGNLNVKTTAPGEWDSSKSKTKASACVGADGNVEISGGELNLTATGGGGKGITCDGDFIVDDGALTIDTSGGVLAYVNGSLNQNYTGNTDRLNSDYKSSPKGVKADGNVEINNGTIKVTTSGNGGEGIESKSEVTVNGGYIVVRAKDDCINSSSTMYIKGGVIDVISTGNDGLDSNGDLYIEGGIVMAFGGQAPECGLDADERHSVYFTGGYVLAGGGGGNSVPVKAGSTQPFVSVNLSVSANTEVSIGTGNDTIYTFTTPSDLTNVTLGGGNGGFRPGGMGQGGSNLLISVPGLTDGTSYTVKSGNNSATATAKLIGSGGFGGGR